MSEHDGEGDKIAAALTLLFFFFGDTSRLIYLSSHKKNVVLILAVADGCNHQMTS